MIPLMRNVFLKEERTKKALADFILSTNRLSMGPKCTEFEKKFSDFQGSGRAMLFNSGGSANLALFQALMNLGRLKKGDKVGFSALTWSTNVMPLIQMGLVPVPVDVEPNTMNVSSEKLRERLEVVDLKGLFITNALGFAGDLDRIRDLCDERGVLFLEDNCESLGTRLHAGQLGSFGHAASFSFYVAHHMSTVEGGMLCTRDEELSEMLRIVRANGWDRNLEKAEQEKWRATARVDDAFYAQFAFFDLGFNLRPTEITGFLGGYQIDFLPEALKLRQENYLWFEKIVERNDDYIPLNREHIAFIPSYSLSVICKSPEIREKTLRRFAELDVETRPIISGNMQVQPYYKKYVNETFELPGAEFIHDCGFYCGNYPELTDEDRETIRRALEG